MEKIQQEEIFEPFGCETVFGAETVDEITGGRGDDDEQQPDG